MVVDTTDERAKRLFEGDAARFLGGDGLAERGFGGDLSGDGSVEIGLRGGEGRDICRDERDGGEIGIEDGGEVGEPCLQFGVVDGQIVLSGHNESLLFDEWQGVFVEYAVLFRDHDGIFLFQEGENMNYALLIINHALLFDIQAVLSGDTDTAK